MFLRDLIPLAATIPVLSNTIIVNATTNPNDISFGSIFFCLMEDFIKQTDTLRLAIENGVNLIVLCGEHGSDTAIEMTFDADREIYYFTNAPLNLYSRAISALHPDRPRYICGVTGTSGKTSTVSFIQTIWNDCGRLSASLGTLGLCIREENLTLGLPPLTTLDAKTFHSILSEIKLHHGIDYLATEVSSHGLSQHRVHGIEFDSAILTNFGHDHLDYHGSFANYLNAKLRLFSALLKRQGFAIINSDDPHHANFESVALSRGVQVATYSLNDGRSDVQMISATQVPDGFLAKIRAVDKKYEVLIPLRGRYQLYNTLAAVSAAIVSGIAADNAIDAVGRLKGIVGRYELVATVEPGARILVDYAHTPDALERLLSDVRAEGPASIVVVVGCGGDRDRSKRKLIGAIAAKHASKIFVTDDNPRSESPEDIRREILEGAPNATEVADRYDAIDQAISSLGVGDILVIVGKGHERFQVSKYTLDGTSATRKRFSDREAVLSIIHERNRRMI